VERRNGCCQQRKFENHWSREWEHPNSPARKFMVQPLTGNYSPVVYDMKNPFLPTMRNQISQ
jgi:hypothetical protein